MAAPIRVEGNFDGFGYGRDSRQVVLKSSELCNDRGAGSVFAILKNSAERDKLYHTQPGARVVLEGEVEKVEQGRFVYLERVTVISE